MSKIVRARYTLEYKQEAVRLVEGGRAIGAVARDLGIADQTVHNWVKAQGAGRLGEASAKPFNAAPPERDHRNKLDGVRLGLPSHAVPAMITASATASASSRLRNDCGMGNRCEQRFAGVLGLGRWRCWWKNLVASTSVV